MCALCPRRPGDAARGVVQFSETGFSLVGVQGRALGGEVRLEGGMMAPPAGRGESPVRVRARGTATAEGLREAPAAGPVSRLGAAPGASA